MGRHVDLLAFGPRQNIETAIASLVDKFGAHHSAHLRITVMLCQSVALIICVVPKIEQVVSGAALIFLPRIKVVPLCN